MLQENDMLIITAVAKETGVSVNTLRWWCQHGLIEGAALQPNKRGVLAWHMPLKSAKARKDNPPKRGNPHIRA